MRFVIKNGSFFAVAWFVLLTALALFAPLFLGAYSQAMDFSSLLEAPSRLHVFGTDALGRDLFLRILVGARVSLGVAVVAVGLALFIGILYGAVSGYYGGFCDKFMMAFLDIMLCFPTFFLILAVIAILGPSVTHIMVIIGATSWMQCARLVRAQVLALKEREFILASRALGATDAWIIFKHLIPNAMGPVIVSAVLGISSAILVESGLSFLGIGVQPPTPSWGNILMEGKATLGAAWWMTVFPGVIIFLTVLSANLLGDRLRDKLESGL